MSFSCIDNNLMQRALALAEKGRYTTTPNPCVGCVIAHDQEVVGEGWHHKAGTPHAEVHALAEAGRRAESATVYVTLEPCFHYGRTGPCADALIAAKVARVVVAMEDPNPSVAGQGIARIRAAGIAVDVGLCDTAAEALNRGFLKRMRLSKPFVTAKIATSLDGKTALANGTSQWITGANARSDVQCYRASSCAVLSSAKTVLMDDASLAVRSGQLPKTHQGLVGEQPRQPLRVIVDVHHQLTGSERLFEQTSDIILVSQQISQRELPEYCREMAVGCDDGHVDLCQLTTKLATEHQINQLWVEAGATLSGALVNANLVDELIVYQAPIVLGHRSRDMLVLPEWQTLEQGKRWERQSVTQVGNDIKMILTPQ